MYCTLLSRLKTQNCVISWSKNELCKNFMRVTFSKKEHQKETECPKFKSAKLQIIILAYFFFRYLWVDFELNFYFIFNNHDYLWKFSIKVICIECIRIRILMWYKIIHQIIWLWKKKEILSKRFRFYFTYLWLFRNYKIISYI